ncbi:MAG: TrlF family AAA-like ATPase [Sandaracinaceae bacterium]
MVTLEDFDQIADGAHFFNADLHVHSFGGSHDVRDATMTPQAIVDEAVKAGTKVLAITDHNSIANTKTSIEHAQQYAGEILVLAGVEITTAHGHLLVYFAPEAVAKLETFVARLEIVSIGAGDSHTTKSMADVIAEAARLDGICVAAHVDRKTGFETSAKGFPNWKKDIVASPGLAGFEFADAANLAWYSNDDATSEAKERRKLLQNRNQRIGRTAPLAHIQSSDAHTLADFRAARAKRSLTRIKMTELTFDGFRTAFADPEARVRATAALPRAVPQVVAMYVGGGFLREERLRFSSNLNCFIGGRGTGKSTALRCLSYALGVNDTLEGFDNCPDSVVVYCRDAAGVLYRYERMRGSPPEVRAKEEGTITNVPADSFPIEYYGQGDLADVARDPLANPRLFQDFLDRNTRLGDLFAKEHELIEELARNGTLLRPLEAQAATRPTKKADHDKITTKLRVAEEGKLKELVASQTRMGAEKTLAQSYEEIRAFYAKGISLANFQRDAKKFEDAAGQRSETPTVEAHLANIKAVIEATNTYLQVEQRAIATELREAASKIATELAALKALHLTKHGELSAQVASFQKLGLSASVADLQRLVKRRGELASEIGRIDQNALQLATIREERATLRTQLGEVRDQITERRKSLVREVNKHLATVIEDYTVALQLTPDGIIDDFATFVVEELRGTYLQEDVIRRMCAELTPQQLASFVAAGDATGLASAAGINEDSAQKLCERLRPLDKLHRLETIWKTPRPAILVIPKPADSKPIPVNQLSDGQRHTIFLTIAMLAESDAPLVIDQPEDDLDNAFIFSSVVETLRRVKEKRQVIVVTHNANIAVLGDAELLFPMQRQDDRGVSLERGAIDRKQTRDAVQRILEGGEEAFRRRMEIYAY